MGGLQVEGYLTLCSNVWKAVLTPNEAKFVCAFCFEPGPHEHSVHGRMVVHERFCSLELKSQTHDHLNKSHFGVEDSQAEHKESVHFDCSDCQTDEPSVNSAGDEIKTDANNDNYSFIFPNNDEIKSKETHKPNDIGKFDSEDIESYVFLSAMDGSSNECEESESTSFVNENEEETDTSIPELSKINKVKPVRILDTRFKIRSNDVSVKELVGKQAKKVNKSGQAKYICDICGRPCFTPSALKVHRAALHGCDVEPITCEACGFVSPTKVHHAYHTKAKHSETRLICQYCGKSFSIGSSFNRHVKMHTNPSTPDVKCTICGLGLKGKARLKIHMKLHLDKQNAHKCYVCGLVFSSFIKLRSHRQVHRFIKVFDKRENVLSKIKRM
ncbi:zinc finger protein 729-like isoform X2 [Artemia franciscana]|uniref:C2H2-type domain-containing protein n=2 Tax=Artemia franciscana TaxID=6661 RepID=A0AA88H8Z9_ARTSF|nr:hypothetical protein QYM36_016759 [Artemia franciscana]KAK2704463.1 hypothetical protein QYM36_016759 [Artemia franciscana]